MDATERTDGTSSDDVCEGDRDHERLAALVERSADVLSITDAHGIFVYLSPACRFAYGRNPDELIGTYIGDIIHPDDLEFVRELNRQVVCGETDAVTFTCRLRHPLLGWRFIESTLTSHLDSPAVRGVVANARDVTERIEVADRLKHQALHDPLTGLANRAQFLDLLDRSLRAAASETTLLAVLFIDLDCFKGINDSLGHSLGDRVLITAADRLREVLRPSDGLARLGGDEFVVLAQGLEYPAQATAVAARLSQAVKEPINVGGQLVSISCSIGISFLGDARSPEMLLQEADLALYQAKERGRNRVEIFSEDMRERAVRRVAAEQAIRRGLDHDHVEVLYQPIVDLRTGMMVSAEALVRLRCPGAGVLGADEVISVAEATGLIIPLGEAVLRAACAQHAAWRSAGVPVRTIAVDISARQLDSPTFPDRFVSIAQQHGLEPDRVYLEVTESTLIDGGSSALTSIRYLKKLGLGLVLDHFGTGWASLAQLRQYPFNAIKIDGSFVSGLSIDQSDTEVVKAVVSLGNALGLQVVAEGVETAEQEHLLTRYGCTHAQGYRYAVPLPGDQIAGLTHLIEQ